MTFLPIVERELRVAARKRSTYWTRAGAAILSLILFAGIIGLAGIGRGAFGAQVGEILFGVFSWLGFAFACSAGVFLTSDSLSEEKREGTLGLLFLTDLRGYDVVLGKLLSSSLVAVYGLFSAFPVMGLSFLLGGVTGGEFWRLMLVLCNTLFFSLAAGMLVSALSRDAQRAMVGALLLCGLFVLMLPVLDGALAGWNAKNFVARCSLASPGYNMTQARASLLGDFWTGLAVVHFIAWVFLGLACVLAPRQWQEAAAIPASGKLPRRGRNPVDAPARKNAERRRWLEANPVRWLAAYDPKVRRWLWMTLGGLAGGFALLILAADDLDGMSSAFQTLNFVLGLVVRLWLISQASRFFVDATRNGTIELLLATPLPPQQIVRGQVWALRRAFLYPVVILLGLTVASQGMMFATIRTAGAASGDFLAYQIVSGITSCVLIVTGVVSTTWFGMWMGLVSTKSNLAVIKTLVFVEVLPWIVTGFLQMFISIGMSFSGFPSWTTQLPVLLFSAGADVVFFVIARRRLLHRFREIVARAAGVGAPRRPPQLPELRTAPAGGTP